MDVAYKITVRGLVQGVGFRPFIYLLANEMGIRGTVSNRSNGVAITAVMPAGKLDAFIGRIRAELPPVASIHSIETEEVLDASFTTFTISPSGSETDGVTQVAPDVAVCPRCMDDRKRQPHRTGYPFINCTHCGPRFSIIRDLPYDRDKTTMSGFAMCPECSAEYRDIADRRFHAQPVACNRCGPKYYTENREYNYEDVLMQSVKLIDGGNIIAVRGIGGYHLVCDATNEQAVRRLRNIKARDTKPFAVMFSDLEAMQPYVEANETEKRCLTSWRRPIVLLPHVPDSSGLASQICSGMKTLGCMLPYMPIHYDWFERLETRVLVMTSANLCDCPIIIEPAEAERQLGGKADLIIHHNRPVHNRVDDSVLQTCSGQACMIRRSRGYVPEPFFADIETEGVIAFGAEKTNTFALGKAGAIIQSQHIGDLKNSETFAFYTESLQRFMKLFRFTPELSVCDMHPDYLSSIAAEQFAGERRVPLIKVQHHHAHAVACMAEYGLREDVLAIVWDGAGLGDDGNIWGSEFLVCNRTEYSRLAHLDYVAMPGGDRAAGEPWRMAVSYAHQYGLRLPGTFLKRIGEFDIELTDRMIDGKINSPLTSGAGRLFDAFASLLGLCDYTTHQAEAAQLLEQCAGNDYTQHYRINAGTDSVSLAPVFEGSIHDLESGVPVAGISAKIHNSLAYLILDKTLKITKETGIRKVLLSGGCFQNRRLTEHLQRLFRENNVPLYLPSKIPCNDAGVSAGQLVIAAEKQKSCTNCH